MKFLYQILDIIQLIYHKNCLFYLVKCLKQSVRTKCF